MIDFSFRSLLIRVVPWVVLLVGCGGAVERFLTKGEMGNRSQSVFQLESGRYCRISDAENKRSLRLNCASLVNFVRQSDSGCQRQSTFRPALGWFPEREQPMRLCQGAMALDVQPVDQLTFAVFGDSGRGELASHGYHQQSVADAMLSVCREGNRDQCRFALIAGDLIYDDGVRDVWDRKFTLFFEKIYKKFGAMPFYGSPGNHDHKGNLISLVEYSWFSDRWRMPHRWYNVPALPEWIKISAIDTTEIIGEGEDKDAWRRQMEFLAGSFCQDHGEVFRLLFGHHPPRSGGKHGDQGDMQRFLAELYERCPFHIYFAGHDHHQEHIRVEEDGYDVVIQGAGGTAIRGVEPYAGQRFARAAHGFSLVEARPEMLDLYFYEAPVRRGAAPLRRDDYLYHCRLVADQPGGCLPVTEKP